MELKQLSLFNKMLNRLHEKIKTASRSRNNIRHVFYVVPKLLFGEHLYDPNECIAYITCKLEENGFLVKILNPNIIFVSWENWVPSYVRNELKKKTGIEVNQYGHIVEKPANYAGIDNRSIRAESLLNVGVAPSVSQQQNSTSTSRFTPIQKYKPDLDFMTNPNSKPSVSFK